MDWVDGWIKGLFRSCDAGGLITRDPQDEISLRDFHDGWVQGGVDATAGCLLTLLEARGLHPSQEQVARVTGCMNPALLEFWFRLAATATRAGEVFAD